MLLQFSVGNFRSFSETKILSMEATSITEFPENTYQNKSEKLLLSAGIYGANSSGKSNLINAMGMMKDLISKFFTRTSTSEIPYDPFLLKANSEKEPTFLEVVFLIDEVRYRYGIEVNEESVVGEWLFEKEKRKEKPLFLRINDTIEVMPQFKEGKDLEAKTRDNALFLTVVDQFNGEKAKKIMKWFYNFNVINGLSHGDYKPITFGMLQNEKDRLLLNDFYRKLDLGFEELKISEESFDIEKISFNWPEEILEKMMTDLKDSKLIRLSAMHKKFDKNNNLLEQLVEFDVRQKESAGTNKVIDLSGPIFDTLKDGGVLVIDELDAKLHPLLTLAILNLFHDSKINLHQAQLIFSTHDTNILKLGRLRRDQIYLTEKNRFGATNLFSLVEYNLEGKKVRKDNSFDKDYLNGRYGAIPFINNLETLN